MVRVALGQLNTTVGDLDGNVGAMAEWTARAAEQGADLICFPELAITGYPPEDLVLRPRFVDDNLGGARRACRRDRRIVVCGDGGVRGPVGTRDSTTPPR